MAQQQHRRNNIILHSFDLPEWVQQKSTTDVDDLFHAFNIEMPINQEASLNLSFGKKCEQVSTGYAWLQKVLQITRRKTYKPAMRHYMPYQHLTEGQRYELDTRVNQV